MKRLLVLASLLFVVAIGIAFMPPGLEDENTTADYSCKKVISCTPGPGSPSGETGAFHMYCGNPSAIGTDYCYYHWGSVEHPCPY